VQLRNDRVFEDRVTDIGNWGEEDWVAFALHGFTSLRSISSCRRARPPAYTSAGKRWRVATERSSGRATSGRRNSSARREPRRHAPC
jgi:hypothetical protein